MPLGNTGGYGDMRQLALGQCKVLAPLGFTDSDSDGIDVHDIVCWRSDYD
jgi:hypothetical protein